MSKSCVLKSVLRLVTRIPLSCFVRGCSKFGASIAHGVWITKGYSNHQLEVMCGYILRSYTSDPDFWPRFKKKSEKDMSSVVK